MKFTSKEKILQKTSSSRNVEEFVRFISETVLDRSEISKISEFLLF